MQSKILIYIFKTGIIKRQHIFGNGKYLRFPAGALGHSSFQHRPFNRFPLKIVGTGKRSIIVIRSLRRVIIRPHIIHHDLAVLGTGIDNIAVAHID